MSIKGYLLKHKKAFTLIGVLLILSPIFGVYLAELTGYHEPLDLAAEALGLKEITEEVNWTPFLDYTIPGLPDWLGYIISGFIGVLVVLLLALIVLRILR